MDGFEKFLVPIDALLGHNADSPHWPSVIESNIPLLTNFQHACRRISRSLLSVLSDIISPKPQTSYEHFHREQEKSTTTLAMLKYLPSSELLSNQIGHMAHTDVGSLTLIFSTSPGLQMLTSSGWCMVKPRPGRIVVNVGDTLRFMSGNALKSCVHRVIPQVGPSVISEARFSLAFFLRPELTAQFVDGEGREWTGEEWHREKYKVFRANNQEQSKTSLLTGEAGFLGHWKGSRRSAAQEGRSIDAQSVTV